LAFAGIAFDFGGSIRAAALAMNGDCMTSWRAVVTRSTGRASAARRDLEPGTEQAWAGGMGRGQFFAREE